jgi:ABC-type glycerol-3-phosphate transport system substrate-binding protein
MKKLSLLISLLVLASLLLAACGGAPATQAPAEPAAAEPEPAEAEATNTPVPEAEGQEVTLKVLVHQNPPMVEFMETFNEQFQAKYPNITVDMSVVNANDLSTVTQTRQRGPALHAERGPAQLADPD